MDYAPALALAQKLGYAEADPTADVEGFDALAKVVILSNVLLGGSLKTADVPCKGISSITKADVEAAKAQASSPRRSRRRSSPCPTRWPGSWGPRTPSASRPT